MAARDTFLSFNKPHLDEQEIAAVVAALRSGWLTTGPRTAEFQSAFAAHSGHAHALGLNSCTAALFLALRVAGIGPGDEVLVPALTFAATANVVVHCGARPVFVDVDEQGALDPAAAEAALTPRTRAIIPVHLYGLPAHPAALRGLADRHGLVLIADCAHATETRVGDVHVARFADLAAFSFYATKNLTTGEGGMLTTDRAEWHQRAVTLSLHGMSQDAFKRYSESGFRQYDIHEAGYKFNMTDIQAALGLEQFQRLSARLARRTAIWRRYDAALADLPLSLPADAPEGVTHARHIYALRLPGDRDRDRLLGLIQEENVGVAVHFRCLPLTSYYRESGGWREGQFPVAEAISRSTFSIPMHPYLTDADAESVIAALRNALSRLG